MTKKVIALNLDDLWLVWGVPTGLFLLIHLITAVVLVFFHADTSLLISGALLPICSGILMLIVSTAHTGFSFFQALRFGQTRRRALAQCMGVILFEGGCSLALISLLTALEHWLAPKFWMFLTGSQSLVWGIRGYAVPDSALADSTVSLPNHTLFIEDFFLSWWWFPVILLGCMALGIIIGAVTARFGRRGGWTLWGIWMVCCFGPQLLGDQIVLLEDFLLWTGIVLGISALVVLIWSFHYLLHAPVKN